MNFFRMWKNLYEKRFYSDLVIIKTVVLTIKIPPSRVCNEGTSPSRKSANDNRTYRFKSRNEHAGCLSPYISQSVDK
ncbi:MAG: hypothetical protein CM1200mP30_06430 [Pseudomonadota bacterium]|nr:MAG: hypothetical protein CM1200mP30_06430 [Pseudomonadota bacterium]